MTRFKEPDMCCFCCQASFNQHPPPSTLRNDPHTNKIILSHIDDSCHGTPKLPMKSYSFYGRFQLSQRNREIRLLRIHPDHRHNHDIRCSLKVVSLNDSPRFTALSYTWGASGLRSDILVEGEPFSATQNLRIALEELRKHPYLDWTDDCIDWLWIDAICINQSDHSERGWQLKQMRDVYMDAETVFVWLGAGDSDSDMAMKWLSWAGKNAMATNLHELVRSTPNRAVADVVRLVTEPSEVPPSRGSLGRIVVHLYSRPPETIRRVQLSTHEPPAPITLVLRLLSREWWSRVWVVQELSVARNPVVACGRKRIPWSELSAAFAVVAFVSAAFRQIATHTARLAPMSLLPTPPVLKQLLPIGSPAEVSEALTANRAANFQIFNRERWRPPGLPLRTILTAAASPTLGPGLASTEEYDRVYGLLGLCSDMEQLGITYDTKRPWQHTFTEVMRALLRQDGNLSLLSLRNFPNAVARDEEGNAARLPSWVVDWSRRMSFANPLFAKPFNEGLGHQRFHAAGPPQIALETRRSHKARGIWDSRRGFVLRDGEPKALFLRARRVSTVIAVMPPPAERIVSRGQNLPSMEIWENTAARLVRWVEQVKSFIGSARAAPAGPYSEDSPGSRYRTSDSASLASQALRVLLADQYPPENDTEHTEDGHQAVGQMLIWSRLTSSQREQDFLRCLETIAKLSMDEPSGQFSPGQLVQAEVTSALQSIAPRVVQEAAATVVRDAARDCGIDPEWIMETEDWKMPDDLLLEPGQGLFNAIGWYDPKVQTTLAALAGVMQLEGEEEQRRGGEGAAAAAAVKLHKRLDEVENGLLLRKINELITKRPVSAYPPVLLFSSGSGRVAMQQNPTGGRTEQNPPLGNMATLTSLAELVSGIGEGRTVFSLTPRRIKYRHRHMHGQSRYREIVAGLGPEEVKAGDVIVVTEGADVPLILRPATGSSRRYLFVGECYVDGIMDGEFWGGNLDFAGSGDDLEEFCIR